MNHWHWEHTVGGFWIGLACLLILSPFFYTLGQMSVEIPEPTYIERVEYVYAEPEVVIEERVVKQVATVVKYVDKEVVKEVIKYRNIYSRQFKSVEHFKEWYKEQDFKRLGPSSIYKVDCDDYAERLQRTALHQGYSVSVALIKQGMYYGVKVSDILEPHAGNLVLIRGVYYYVEPLKEPQLKKVVNRD